MFQLAVFAIFGLIVLAVVFFGGIGMVAYVLPKSMAKIGAPLPVKTYPTPMPAGGWEFQYSVNTVQGQTPEDFDFPIGQDGVHYCVKKAPSMSGGQTVTIKFTLTGTGTLAPTQGTTPCLSLYMQRTGDDLSGRGAYQQYRYWHSSIALTKMGDFVYSAPLNPDQWTDVFGKKGSDFASQFQACVTNAGAIGFTLGDPAAGASGHGMYAKGGPVHFHLSSFTVA